VSVHDPKIFALNKPVNVSSAKFLGEFKRSLGKKYSKVGHFGTLDPFAGGVLLVGVAGAMRLMDLVQHDLSKTYLAVGKLGVSSDTGDREGKKTILHDELWIKKNISQEKISEVLVQKFNGPYWQAPHVYSAAKFQGKNLYEWARQGVEIKKEKVLRHVYRCELVKVALPYVSLRTEVSSGTYIRTLFEDLAHELGTSGYLISLMREQIGPVKLRDCLGRKAWQSEMPTVSLIDLLAKLPSLTLGPEELLRLQQGKLVPYAGNFVGQKVLVLDEKGQVMGVALASENVLASHINFIR
jgi:tRNA pseudouridine55 synthase